MADLTKFINLLAQTDGRDKIYKTLQNLVKIAAAQSSDKAQAKKFNTLAKSLGEGRSLMRMAKWTTNYNKLVEYSKKASTLTSRQIVEILRVIGDFGYILGDNLSYLAKYGVLPFNASTTAKNSKIFQFWGFFFATLLDVWAMITLRAKAASGMDEATYAKEAKALRLSLVKNFCDLLVTLNAVGYASAFYKPSGTALGVFGATSGAIATYNNWKKTKA